MNRPPRYAFPPLPLPALSVRGTDELMPVHRIYCVGRNYAEHAREMGHDPDREPPFFFQKNPDNLVPDGGEFPYPPLSHDVHHELEMVVALREGGRDIPVERALDHVFGYAVGLDMTRRDLQADMKKQGRPWCIGKAFDQSAPVGAITPAKDAGDIAHARIALQVNGETRQQSDLSQLIWSIGEIVEHLSNAWTLAPGDLIMTGTPEGVAAVVPGDRLVGSIEGLPSIEVRIRG